MVSYEWRPLAHFPAGTPWLLRVLVMRVPWPREEAGAQPRVHWLACFRWPLPAGPATWERSPRHVGGIGVGPQRVCDGRQSARSPWSLLPSQGWAHLRMSRLSGGPAYLPLIRIFWLFVPIEHGLRVTSVHPSHAHGVPEDASTGQASHPGPCAWAHFAATARGDAGPC